MKSFLAFLLLFGIVMAGALPVRAEDGKPPKALVEDLSKKAHDGFLRVKNKDGQPIVKPEDAKKLTYPIVSYDEREMAVARGYLSAYANWCGLNWGKDYYAPYMKALQVEHGKKWTPHQYAYVEVLHGLSMSVATQDKKGKKCPDAEKVRIAALAKK